MNPPITFDVNIPSNHNTTKMTAIVCNICFLPLMRECERKGDG